MKTKNMFLIILVAFFGFTITASAQYNDQMNSYISYMANKKKKMERRLEKKANALNLFLGEGNRYKEFGEYKEGVLMQITSKRTKKVTSTPLMRVYFQHLIEKFNLYSDVNISSTEVAGIKVTKLRRVDTNEWVCTCQYDQVFEGIRDGRLIYRDITHTESEGYDLQFTS